VLGGGGSVVAVALVVKTKTINTSHHLVTAKHHQDSLFLGAYVSVKARYMYKKCHHYACCLQ
jgi:hypothetical protein